MSTLPTISCADFLSMLAANTHCNWNTPGWQSAAQVQKCLQYTGITCIRDAPPYAQFIDDEYDGFFKTSGVTVNVCLNDPGDGSSDLAEIKSCMQQYPGVITSIEGLNETTRGFAAQNASQQTAHDAIKADPVLSKALVIAYSLATTQDYSGGGDQSGRADRSNCHPYANSDPDFNGGIAGIPEPNMLFALNSVRATSPSLVPWITEDGRSISPNEAWAYASDPDRAKFGLRMWAYAALMGVGKLFYYELIDNASDALTVGEDGFGLFDSNGNPYLLAKAIATVKTILADKAEPASLVQVTASVTNATYVFALLKSNGDEVVIPWNENGTTSGTVTFPAAHATITVYDPLVATSPQTIQTNAASITLTIPDHPIIIVASAALQAAPAPTPVAPAPTPTPVSPTPSPTPHTASASGTTVTLPGHVFYDTKGQAWELKTSSVAGVGNQIYVAGVLDGTTLEVTAMWWIAGNVIQKNTGDNFYAKHGGNGSWIGPLTLDQLITYVI